MFYSCDNNNNDILLIPLGKLLTVNCSWTGAQQ